MWTFKCPLNIFGIEHLPRRVNDSLGQGLTPIHETWFQKLVTRTYWYAGGLWNRVASMPALYIGLRIWASFIGIVAMDCVPGRLQRCRVRGCVEMLFGLRTSWGTWFLDNGISALAGPRNSAMSISAHAVQMPHLMGICHYGIKRRWWLSWVTVFESSAFRNHFGLGASPIKNLLARRGVEAIYHFPVPFMCTKRKVA